MRRLFKYKYWVEFLFLFGCFFHLITNIGWQFINDESLGVWLYFTGVAMVKPVILLATTFYFKEKKSVLYFFSDFFLNLSIAQLFTQLFLNPFKFQPSEIYNFIFATIILLYRLKVFKFLKQKIKRN